MKIVYTASRYSRRRYGGQLVAMIQYDMIERDVWDELKAINGYKLWYTAHDMRKLKDMGFVFMCIDQRGISKRRYDERRISQ